jgi:trk system potassium uptake protein TrkA
MRQIKQKTAIIIGSGRFGANIAGALSDQSYHVTVIDKDSAAFRKLPESFGGYQMTGNGADIDVLRSAGIDHVKTMVISTDQDNVNCLIAEIASRVFHVPNIYVRLDDPAKEHLLEGFDVHAIYPFKLSVNEFEKLSALTVKEEINV